MIFPCSLRFAGLDTNLAVAAVVMIAARAFLAGDADCLLHQIIRESGTQPPAVMSIPDPFHATPASDSKNVVSIPHRKPRK
jgi:hypothetical protein